MRDSDEMLEMMEMLQKKRKDAEAREAAVAVDVTVEEVEGEESIRNTKLRDPRHLDTIERGGKMV